MLSHHLPWYAIKLRDFGFYTNLTISMLWTQNADKQALKKEAFLTSLSYYRCPRRISRFLPAVGYNLVEVMLLCVLYVNMLPLVSNWCIYFYAAKIGIFFEIAKLFYRYFHSMIPNALATAFLMKALIVIPSLLAAIAALLWISGVSRTLRTPV